MIAFSYMWIPVLWIIAMIVTGTAMILLIKGGRANPTPKAPKRHDR